MNSAPIRVWQSGRFRLELRDTGRRDWRGQSKLAYRFTDGGKVIFEGDDFAGSPMHADDSDETVAALLSFLSLLPGDTDPDYFDRYSPAQLDWARANGEELGLLASEMEERARRGFVACTVESHYSAWLVTFDDGATLLLQSDYDQAAFAVACPRGWARRGRTLIAGTSPLARTITSTLPAWRRRHESATAQNLGCGRPLAGRDQAADSAGRSLAGTGRLCAGRARGSALRGSGGDCLGGCAIDRWRGSERLTGNKPARHESPRSDALGASRLGDF